MRPNRAILVLAAAALAATAWAAALQRDRWTCLFSLLPGLAGVAALVVTYPAFRFSKLVYALAGVYFVIVAAGARYAYSDAAFLSWAKDSLHLSASHYDFAEHLVLGIALALIVRELLVRAGPLVRGRLLSFLSIMVPPSASALYDSLQWWAVIFFFPAEGAQWLALEGDRWQMQARTLAVFIGAAMALWTISRAHDRSMAAAHHDTTPSAGN